MAKKRETMVYRAITRRTAEWIGMAAKVAGGYVAVDGPRLSVQDGKRRQVLEEERIRMVRYGRSKEDIATIDAEIASHRCGQDEWMKLNAHGNLLVLAVPSGYGLAREGRAIPSSLLPQVQAALAEAGYTAKGFEP